MKNKAIPRIISGLLLLAFLGVSAFASYQRNNYQSLESFKDEDIGITELGKSKESFSGPQAKVNKERHKNLDKSATIETQARTALSTKEGELAETKKLPPTLSYKQEPGAREASYRELENQPGTFEPGPGAYAALDNRPPASTSENSAFWTNDHSPSYQRAALSLSGGSAILEEAAINLRIAKINEAYCESLAGAAGADSESAELVGGQLPPGLLLNSSDATLCGKPTTGGIYSFQVNLLRNFSGRGYTFRLVVSETDERSDEESSSLKILDTSFPQAVVGENYFKQLRASGGQAPYLWKVSGLPSGLSYDSPSGVVGGSPRNNGEYALNIDLTDSSGAVLSRSSNLLVITSPLAIKTAEISPATVGESYSFPFAATGGTPPYSWQMLSGRLMDGLSFSGNTGRISGMPLKSGNSTLRVRVSDSNGSSDSVELVFSVEDGALQILDETIPTPSSGEPYRYALRAKGGKPPYTWEDEAAELPSGLSLSTSGVVSGRTNSLAESSAFTAKLRDSDGQEVSKKLFFNAQNQELEIVTETIPEAFLCTAYNFTLRGRGGELPYRWKLLSGYFAEGIALSGDGQISGIPSGEAQDLVLSVELLDALGNSNQKDYLFRVSSPPLEVKEGESRRLAEQQEEIEFSIAVQGGCPPYLFTYSSSSLPEGISATPQGIISGKTQETGNFELNFEVRDSKGLSETGTVLLSVGSSNFSISEQSPPKARNGESYSFSLTAQGGELPYLWSILSGELPEGLSLVPRTGIISGTPKAPGDYQFKIAASDALGAKAEAFFSLPVEVSELEMIIPNGGDLLVKRDESIDFRISAKGGLIPYKWSLSPGTTLPQGLEVKPGIDLVLSGKLEAAGEFSVSITLEDSLGETVSESFMIRTERSTLDILSESPLSLTPESDNSSITVLRAEGGEAPYRWTLVSSSLDGYHLATSTGVLTGPKLLLLEEAEIVVRLDDAIGNSVEKIFFVNGEEDFPPVTKLIVRASDKVAGLAWEAPEHPLLEGILIVRSLDPPLDAADGELVYAGGAKNIVDSNLVNDTTYHYAAFADYGTARFSEAPSQARGTATPRALSLRTKPDVCIDRVVSYNPLDPNNAAGASRLPNIVLGVPQGGGDNFGSPDVVSLHARVNNDGGRSAPYGGSITLEFTDNIVVDGPGVDFTVFENSFRGIGEDYYWIEPAVVDVSIDGVKFYRFPFDFIPHYNDDGTLNLNNPHSYATGFAGVRPVYSAGGSPDPSDPSVSGGDSFDLANIREEKLSWIAFVRITSTGDNWLTDINGDKVRHSHQDPTWGASGTGNSGFDLDAVCAVNYGG